MQKYGFRTVFPARGPCPYGFVLILKAVAADEGVVAGVGNA